MSGRMTAADLLLFSGSQWTVILGALALGLVLHGLLVLWLHRDVKAAGRRPWSWTLAGAMVLVPTLLVWRVVRPKVQARPTVTRPAAMRAAAASTAPASRSSPAAHAAARDPYRVGLRGPIRTERPGWSEVRPRAAGGSSGRLQYATGLDGVTCMVCGVASDLPPKEGGHEWVSCPNCGTRHRV